MDGLELLDDLDKDTVMLMVLDLPYYKVVKNGWDNQWKTLDDYLDWCKEWFVKSERVLKDNGSLYYFNSQFKIIKAIDTLIESCTALNFRQFITIDKGIASVAGRTSVDALRSYPNASEYLMFYTFQDESSLTSIYSNKDCFKSIKEYMTSEYTKTGLSYGEINKLLEVSTNGGGMACHFFSIGNKIWMLPVKKLYEKLQTTGFFGREYEDLRREYEDLRREYEDLRYPFNLQPGHTDVWHFNFYKEHRHGHPTQKPFDLIKRIVLTSSNEGDLVCDPAMGTGTTMKVCGVHDRNFIGAEIDSEYEHTINDRCLTHTPTLQSYMQTGDE
jgi:site-specific DNA-methyltransferase (adenine-specific)